MHKEIKIEPSPDDENIIVWSFTVDGTVVASGREEHFLIALAKARQARKEYHEKELAKSDGTSQPSVEGN